MIISVIIPLYNKENHIERAIKSVLNQTYKDFELIIVDDGSTDNGLCVVNKIYDPRIKVIKQKNKGVSIARNNGAKLATGELICFLDADDEYKHNFLENILKLYKKYPKVGAYATNYIIQENNKSTILTYPGIEENFNDGIIEDYFTTSIPYTPVWTSAVAIPKNIFIQLKGFPIGIKNGEDLDLWCRIALEYKIAYLNTVGAIYHRDSENMASKNNNNLQLFPFLEDIPRLVIDDKIDKKIRKSLAKYNDYKKLHAISTQLFINNNKLGTKKLLKESKISNQYKVKKIVYSILINLPISFIKILYSFKNQIKG